MALEITIEPDCPGWRELIAQAPSETIFGHPVRDWFAKTRRELGLDESRPIVATGHQTLLWHPGILVKYLAVDAVARSSSLATANLIVDQHADAFGDFDIPVTRSDGTLTVRRMHLTTPRKGVPMGLHEPFTPPRPPGKLGGVLPSVAQGMRLIHERVYAHRDAPNAARQMASALSDLTEPWVDPMPGVTATELMGTTFAREVIAKMADDSVGCAEAYNDAVRGCPDAGIGALLIRDDYVELPLWRIRPDGRRMHAYDNDAQVWLDAPPDAPQSAPQLMPRALLLTALVRLGMCDLFVHGMGGAIYDRAMESWIINWLGIKPSAIAMATATLRLPLVDDDFAPIDLDSARRARREAWHDPESTDASETRPGPQKAQLLEAIAGAPQASARRRAAFFELHETLGRLRGERQESINRIEQAYEQSRVQAMNDAIARRRDWAFPLYPHDLLDELASDVQGRLRGEAACPG